jgi:hypothetical protein
MVEFGKKRTVIGFNINHYHIIARKELMYKGYCCKIIQAKLPSTSY